MRTRGARALVVLATVFLAVALWNGVLALEDQVAWRSAAAGVCAAASAGLLRAAVCGPRR
ncbi:hypothetical protein [Saccharothrix yanglingensis]|uniref:Uncharacterized protein n=1 Tax=Saccharothrix yanglingensis TaxID=659496 RepID=A0ABU0X043_9PSEU|nr:hypothetical protein [Saccharothrix yanglingensis]MDQ2585495.1 hypothetical protein [Saccharothrix yanglingensis]